MSAMTTFSTDRLGLENLLGDIKAGKIQLPDFQRGWVWDDNHILSLLASVSLSYPIGAIMMLETGNEEVRFQPRPVEGVEGANGIAPDRLILDGQQRLTSLLQALSTGKATQTRDVRNKPLQRWYYIDIEKSLDPNVDREEIIISLPEDRIVRNFRGETVKDYSAPEREYEAGIFPLAQVFDSRNWSRGYNKYWNYAQSKLELYDEFDSEVIKRFEQYQIPVIQLGKNTPKEAVCQVFEKVNTGGVSLTVFELLTATFAIDDFKLREDWAKREKQLREKSVLSSVQSDDFLQAITLLTTRERRQKSLEDGASQESAPGISCKRKEILRLTLADYQRWADPVMNGFKQAAKLLYSQQIYAARDLPYRTQLTPLAAIMALLGDRADSDGVRRKLAQWYWCGIFGELYGAAVETRFAKDLPEVLAWLDGGEEPTTIADANFAPTRLPSLRTRGSAAYKGVQALLLANDCLDFRTGASIDEQIFFDEKVDVHHVFPQSWCKKEGIDQRRYNSIINKTPISAKTNRIIGGSAPNIYLVRLQNGNNISSQRMNEILSSHIIEPSLLRANDFDAFFTARETALLRQIEKAMGKSLVMQVVPMQTDEADEDEDQEQGSDAA